MNVGFTGTRRGMSRLQVAQLNELLRGLHNPASCGLGVAVEFHFGGAVGADLQARANAVNHKYDIHWHPCPGVVATGETAHEHWHEVLPPLQRNKRIVEASQILIAAPLRDVEELRSGTWATVRRARKRGIPIVMLPRGNE